MSVSKKKLLQGSASNMVQLGLSMGVSLVVPPFLVHHMVPAEYSAWVLILQLSAYINYLEFGLQTAIGKFVAEHHAAGDRDASSKVVGTAFTLLSGAALLGTLAVLVITYDVPSLFHQMPQDLFHEVRVGTLAIGLSTALMLPFSVFSSIFTGLQRYIIPGIVLSTSRVVSACALISLLLLHGSLVAMAMLLATTNIATAMAQFFCWKRYASHDVPLRLPTFDRRVARRLAEYCGILAIWMVGALFISGLDTVVVGHFDFAHTGYYAVAASATNLMLLIVGNVFGPLLPAMSSIQGERTPEQMGALLTKTTRYSTLLVCALAISLFVCGFPVLTVWLGRGYASRSLIFLEILVLANAIRQLGYPYALMVIAMGKQRLATVAPVAEAIVNFVVSIWLAHKFGAIGVAIGTMVGAVVGIAAHLAISMYLTRNVIRVQRLRFIRTAFLRPLLCALPTVALYPFWHRLSLVPMSPLALTLWVVSTLLIAWLYGINAGERVSIRHWLGRLVYSFKLTAPQ
jgi:O-antigen/teichoic acid export membrane protein